MQFVIHLTEKCGKFFQCNSHHGKRKMKPKIFTLLSMCFLLNACYKNNDPSFSVVPFQQPLIMKHNAEQRINFRFKGKGDNESYRVVITAKRIVSENAQAEYISTFNDWSTQNKLKFKVQLYYHSPENSEQPQTVPLTDYHIVPTKDAVFSGKHFAITSDKSRYYHHYYLIYNQPKDNKPVAFVFRDKYTSGYYTLSITPITPPNNIPFPFLVGVEKNLHGK